MFLQSNTGGSALVLHPASLDFRIRSYSIFTVHLTPFASPEMLLFTEGYICITHANGI